MFDHGLAKFNRAFLAHHEKVVMDVDVPHVVASLQLFELFHDVVNAALAHRFVRVAERTLKRATARGVNAGDALGLLNRMMGRIA